MTFHVMEEFHLSINRKKNMKTLNILIPVMGVALAASSTALANEGHDHPAGGGLFGLPPEYLHVLLNPLPVYGMAMGVLALGAALLARNKNGASHRA